MPYFGVTPAAEFSSKDLNGEQLILDADADTTITADTDDQIDIRISGADDFQFTANTFTAQSGSTIAAQALTATTGVFSSDVTGLTINATGDTAASDNAAIGYTSAEGLILTGQGSTDDITVKNDADTTVVNVATGGTDVEISAGNLLFGTGSKGVYLGVTSATAANLLDDYEEGTYDATLVGASGGSFVLNSSYNSFSYTKIGRVVNVMGFVNISSDSSTSGHLRLSLPFAALQLAEYQDSFYSNDIIFTDHADSDTNADILGWISGASGAAYAAMYRMTHGTGAIATLTNSEVDTAFSVSISLSYMAA